METPEISLIIPVYNVEKFLSRALESVKNQTFKNFEAILVDDGSTDESLKICEKYCNENDNFILLKQNNKGPGEARNTALKICKGNYIGFMDSDDYLEPEFLESLYNAAVESNADIACCNFNMYFPDKNLKIYMPFNTLPGIYSKTKALRKLILDMGIHYFVWNKLVKREIFFDNNLKFDNMYFEDVATSPKLFYFADKIILVGKALYNYTSRDKSILHSIDAQKVNDYIRSLGIIRNFLEKESAFKDYNNHFWVYAQKTKIVTYYYILMLHTKAMNFSGIMENLNNAKRSINYFTDKKFEFDNNDNAPGVPYPIHQPKKINKKNKI